MRPFYNDVCVGYDELLGNGCVNWLGMGLTVVDSLDTLWLSGLDRLWRVGVDWVSRSLSLSGFGVNVFEVTIRVLGGLLSAYALSGEMILLRKAEDLGYRILSSWNADEMPWNRVGRRQTRFSLAEVGSLQLEFRYLWYATQRSDLKGMIMSRICPMFERLF